MMLLVAIATGASASKTVHVYPRGWGDMTGYKIAAYGWTPTEFFTDLQPDSDYPPCYKITVDDNCDYLIFCKFDANATNSWDNTNIQTYNVDVYQEGANDVLVIITEDFEQSANGNRVYKCECSTIDKLSDYVTNVETGGDEMFYYKYDDATQTATVTYRIKDGSAVGGSYTGDVVIPAKAPNGYDVTTIGENAFLNSNSMTSLTIPATIDSIGCRPFEGCDAKLKKITIDDSDKLLRCHIWEVYPFGVRTVFGSDVSVEDVYIGRCYTDYVERGAVEVAGKYTASIIYGNASVVTVTLGAIFQEIPDNMFQGCTALQTVNLRSALKRVGNEAFLDCGSLAEFNVPEGVESIGERAFKRCNALKEIRLPSTLKFIGGEAFNSCKELGPLFTIPGSVDSIGVSILDNCSNLKRIDVAYSSNPLKYCCSSQFYNSLRSAPIDTLSMDRNIKGAFSDNRTLKKLYVGPHVQAMSDYLFSDCYSIDEIYSFNPVPPTCEGGRVFAYIDKNNCRLHVPVGSIDAYKEAFVWKDFFNIDTAVLTSQKSDSHTITDSYSLSGQRTNDSQRGLIIQRMHDGTTRKVINH